MNQDFRDGENQAYAVLLESLWDKGLLSGYGSLRSAAECLLGGFLPSDQIFEVLYKHLLIVEPPSEDGWYIVKVYTQDKKVEERRLYFYGLSEKGGNGWLTFDQNNLVRTLESGVDKGTEIVIGWCKDYSGDRVHSEE